ncbi:unnamed protein product [Lepeophtheirus salmonis]|uniref:(salmon louse) hypothetical protein n=1 Tax=Lepeophtheirus salmonis TaxID=72036 RepID=A0A7R8D5B6_LEPSM|nr:unnamed protein product [Lepeophtheirus salmonis]CAF3004705.1 unnamed protein product [Lepeophtheirus salmonis]
MLITELPALRGTSRQKHDKLYKDSTEKAEAVKHAMARYNKQSTCLKVSVNIQGNFTDKGHDHVVLYGSAFLDDMVAHARHNQDKDVVTVITGHFEDRGVDMKKVFAVTTNGAPSMVDFNDVMATVSKVINLVQRSALTHRQFISLLEEIDSAYTDLPLHSATLSATGGRDADCETDISRGHHRHLNELNLKLQGEGQTVQDMFETSGPQNETSALLKIAEYMHELEEEFPTYFVYFRRYGPMFSFLIKPDSFNGQDLDTALIDWMDVQGVKSQLIELKRSSLWGYAPAKFGCLKNIAWSLLSMFGSTYL